MNSTVNGKHKSFAFKSLQLPNVPDFGSCVVNFIYIMTKMRYKQGKGDPAGFKTFIKY